MRDDVQRRIVRHGREHAGARARVRSLGMLREIARVLKRGGFGIFLIPQMSTTRLAPHFYGNFSGYWLKRAMREAGLEIIEHRRLGGLWSITTSHSMYFFLHAPQFPGMLY